MDEKKPPEDEMVQKCIDPETGEDITGRYIAKRLEELARLADTMIETAAEEYRNNPAGKNEIFLRFYYDINEKLGQGSIGPATAAAGPLMQDKQEKLADILDFDITGFLFGAHEIPPRPPDPEPGPEPEVLTNAEINELLRGPEPEVSSREKIRNRFLENGEAFDNSVVTDLIRDELDEREKNGEGAGLWSGGEACYVLTRLQRYRTDPLPKGNTKITATIEMEYLSSHMVAEKGADPAYAPRTAVIRITVDGNFESRFFSFSWE